MGRKSTSDLEKWSERTDARIQLMKEIISSIQVIKMYAWELCFAGIVDKIRKFEINAIRGYYNHKAFRASLMTVTRISVLLTILAHIYSNESITARKLFVISSIFTYLNYTMVSYWPESFRYLSEMRVSMKRIQSFLELKSMSRYRLNLINDNSCVDDFSHQAIQKSPSTIKQNDESRDCILQLINMSASWTSSSKNENVGGVFDINFKLKDKALSVIVGPVGSGKSTLLHFIIDELESCKGGMVMRNDVSRNISYASQEPWLFDGTVQKNIIFTEDLNEKRYREVCRVCALDRDFELLPLGDRTVVGENGIILSGGQKARVNLARALYKSSSIYILDDPLSSVDAHVAKHIFNECICGFLKNKAVLLVTHQTQFIKNADYVVVMDGGRIISQGKPDEIKLSHQYSKIDEISNKVKPEVLSEETSKKQSSDNITDDNIDEEQIVEGSHKGLHILEEYLLSTSKKLVIFVFSICFIKHLTMSFIDYFLTSYINWEESQSISISINSEQSCMRQSYVFKYTGMTIFLVLLFFLRDFSFYTMTLDASVNLHNRLLKGVVRTGMTFFHKNSSGRILNRFSRDVNTIDEALPDVLSDTLTVSKLF